MWHEGLESVTRGLELARRIGDRTWESSFLAGTVDVLIMLGRWDEALERAAEAEELVATEFAQALALAVVFIHGHRGALDRAREMLTRHADVARSENPDSAASWASLDAAVLALEGRPKEALAAAHRAVGFYQGAGTGGAPAWILFMVFDAAADAEPDDIRKLLALLDELTKARAHHPLARGPERTLARPPAGIRRGERAHDRRGPLP